MKNKKIILASASPRRKELLAQIGIDFEVRPSHAEEVTTGTRPAEIVMDLSRLKAADIFGKLTEEEKQEIIVIGSDTVVALDGEILGKPKDEADSTRMLSAIQGREHQVYTGVSLFWMDTETKEEKETVFFEETWVEVYPMTREEIKRYQSANNCLDKAGSYGIQDGFAAHIKCINGDYNNVVGLPIGRLYQEMKKLGISNS
ncbi:MAG: septum formation protein Maf [Lachnospiraceae bacterium]|nr:septum formation protein Maf [Lachnospiraceae bacterium]